jgi:stromal membrane-associated protein
MSRKQNTKNKQTKRPTLEDPEQVEFRKILDDLVKLPENKVCADCKKASPKWASATLGVFLCMDCAGHHRSLGVHISFIRSTSMDIWEAEYIENMKTIGNEKSNLVYEAGLNESQRPRWGDKTGLSNFIREKYSERRFCERKKNNQNKNQQQKNTKKKRGRT